MWADDRDEMIKEFAETNPLTADIRDKFLEYDSITEDLIKTDRIIVIGPIEINMDPCYNAIIEESKKWKVTLGRYISTTYKKQLDKMVEFIHDQEKILKKPIVNLDDVRLAMKCLTTVRENFIQ